MRIINKEITYTEYLSTEIPAEYLPLIEEAKRQTLNAYAIYSNFKVGAAVLLENGKIIGGNNQENSAYPSGICAERTAMFYANSQYPDTAVKAIAIAAYTNGEYLKDPITPCGGCRQVLVETESRYGKDLKVILYGTDKIYVLDSIKRLLPFSFGKERLD